MIPKVAGQRSPIGDIGVDRMLVRNHKSVLLVMINRTTLITMLKKLKSKSADEVYEKNEQETN